MVNYFLFISSSSLSFELLDLVLLLRPLGFPVLITVGPSKAAGLPFLHLPLKFPESAISYETWPRRCSIFPQIGMLMFLTNESFPNGISG